MAESTSNRPIIHWRVLWSSSWLFGWAILFSFFVALFSLTLPFFMLLVYDRVLNARSVETLTALMTLAGVLVVGMGLLDYARRRLLARFAARLQERLESELIALPPRSATFGTTKALGMGELDQLRGFVHSGSLRNVIDVLWLPIFVSAVFLLSRTIGWLAIVGLVQLSLIYGIGWLLNSHRRRESMRASGRAKQAIATLERAGLWLGGQSFSEQAEDSLLQKRGTAREAALHAADGSTAIDVLISTMRWGFAILVLSLGAGLILANKLTVGGMIACMVLMNKVFFPYIAFLNNLPNLHKAVANWRAIGVRLAQRSDTVAPETLEVAHAPLLALRGVRVKGDLETDPVLRSVDLTVTPGEVIEIIGPAGSGKTLLCETMVWARRPARGFVLGHGHRFSTLRPEQIGALLGYVPEVPLFLRDTIAANISGLDTANHSPAVARAARRSGLDARIAALPKGYETRIDEVGQPLSRGDRELLSLTRALYRSPAVVVIDEPSQTLVSYFDVHGAPQLEAFLQAGGALVLCARTPLETTLPLRRFILRDGSLQPIKLAKKPRAVASTTKPSHSTKTAKVAQNATGAKPILCPVFNDGGAGA